MGGYADEPDAPLVVFARAERRIEKGFGGRSAQSRDAGLFLSGGCGRKDAGCLEEEVNVSNIQEIYDHGILSEIGFHH